MREWWDGSPAFQQPQQQAVLDFRTNREAPPPAPAIRETPSIARWSPTRQRVVQKLFGEGMVRPGGEEAMRELTRPLGINPNLSVAEIGAGLGEMSRMLAREGVWVDSYEGDADLAEAGNALSRTQRLQVRTSIRHVDLDQLHLRRRSLDVVISKEGILTVSDKPVLMAKIRAALKAGGQLMFTDYLRTGDPSSRVHEVWMEREPTPPVLMTPTELRQHLTRLEFDILYMEDVTPAYKSRIIQAYAKYAEELRRTNGIGHDENEREWVVTEGEHWAIRISALDANIARVYQVYCRARDIGP